MAETVVEEVKVPTSQIDQTDAVDPSMWACERSVLEMMLELQELQHRLMLETSNHL